MSQLWIRTATIADEPFLWKMLYQALFVPPGEPPPDPAVVRRPEIAHYVDGWGREGDIGVIAHNADRSEPIGAAWLRLFQSTDKGYGYVADCIPEMGIAIWPEQRGRGVGTALLNRLLELASTRFEGVSLSVSQDNPARYLYERVGFVAIRAEGNSIVMVKWFKTR